MTRIVAIVEGHGEVDAVPILIRRIAQAVSCGSVPDVPRPIRVKRQRLVQAGELERAVELAARRIDAGGGMLVLLDADRDCPAQVGPAILDRAVKARSDRRIRVVLAKSEFESWFLAAAGSIAGHRGISKGAKAPDDPESIRDAKRWLSDRMPAGRSYRETLDQPALTAVMDLQQARRASASFEKLWRDVTDLLRP